MKRARRIAIALVLALVLQTVTGFLGTSSVNAVLAYAAPYQIEGTVTAGILNVRKGAGTKYDCIGTLTKGQKVTIIGTATAGNGVVWYKIEATISGKKVTGYSTSNYISAKSTVPGTTGTKTAATPTPTKGTAKLTPSPTTKAATPTPTQAAKTNGSSSGRVAIVNVTRMNVRKGATTSSDVLGKAYSGDRLPILGSAKDSSGYTWYLVEITLNGKLTKGYVYGNYVTVTTAEKTPTPKTITNASNRIYVTPFFIGILLYVRRDVPACSAQTQGNRDGVVHPAHHILVQLAHAFPQALFVDGADLLQQDHGVLGETAARPLQGDVGGQAGLPRLGGDGRRDHGGRIAVADVVLHDKYRPHPALLAAHHGAQVRIINIASSDCPQHCFTLRRFRLPIHFMSGILILPRRGGKYTSGGYSMKRQ